MAARLYTNARGKTVSLDISFLPDSEAKKLKPFVPTAQKPDVLKGKAKNKNIETENVEA